MKTMRCGFGAMLCILFTSLCVGSQSQTARWSEQKANDWYAKQPWLVGSNYVPKDAINELEMWQDATFDPARSTRNWAGPKAWV